MSPNECAQCGDVHLGKPCPWLESLQKAAPPPASLGDEDKMKREVDMILRGTVGETAARVVSELLAEVKKMEEWGKKRDNDAATANFNLVEIRYRLSLAKKDLDETQLAYNRYYHMFHDFQAKWNDPKTGWLATRAENEKLRAALESISEAYPEKPDGYTQFAGARAREALGAGHREGENGSSV